MDSLSVNLRQLTREHLSGTPLGSIIPVEAWESLLAIGKAGPGVALTVLYGGVAVGLGVIAANGEVMIQVAPEAQQKGLGTSVVQKLVARARPFMARVFATARHLTAGEKLARRAGLVEVHRTAHEATFEAVPMRLYHYTGIDKFELFLKSAGVWNVLVGESADEEDMRIAAEVIDDIVNSKTEIEGGHPTREQRTAWGTCVGAARHDEAALGMTCLSDDPDSRALWDFPSPDAPSVALELDTDPLLIAARAFDPRAFFVKCVADRDEQEAAVDGLFEFMSRQPPEGMRSEDINTYASGIAQEFAYRFVYSGFGGEREWRLLTHTSTRGDSGEVLLSPLVLRSVRIQPEFFPAERSRVLGLLHAAGYSVTGEEDNLLMVAKK